MLRALTATALMLGLVAHAYAATAVTLRYQAANRWVAAADNAPLRTLMKAARTGTHTFVFRLPAGDRQLHEERVEIIRGLLQREAEKQKAQKGIVLEEGEGNAPTAQTIWIQPVD